jgi:ParB-like chromosome segregation protein Spo0J
MNAAPFDTLKMASKLETAGFVPQQAAGVAEAMAEAMSVADLATKMDIARLDTGLSKLEAELARVEKDLRAEIKSESRSLRHDIELLRRDMDLLGRDLTLRLGGMMVAGFGLVLGAMRYMLAHP